MTLQRIPVCTDALPAPFTHIAATSAGCTSRLTATVLLISLGLSIAPGSAANPPYVDQKFVLEAPTSAGARAPDKNHRDHASELALVRRFSGWTWDQLAEFFGVSRRTMHLWASGGGLSRPHANQLENLANVFRQVRDRHPASVRIAMNALRADGISTVKLLAEGRYIEASRLLAANSEPSAGRPSFEDTSAILATRRPVPPAELVGALQDRPFKTSGRILARHPIRTKRVNA